MTDTTPYGDCPECGAESGYPCGHPVLDPECGKAGHPAGRHDCVVQGVVSRLYGDDEGSVMIAYALLLVMPVIFLATLAGAALSAVG